MMLGQDSAPVRAYHFHRATGHRPPDAMALAWRDAMAGTRRERPSRRDVTVGARFKVGNYSVRWVEYAVAVGLRFVGTAEDILEHKRGRDAGPFSCDEHGDIVARGVVYALPARDGRAVLVAGVADPHNSDKNGCGPAMLALDRIIYGERNPDKDNDGGDPKAGVEAAELAARIAETYADDEREYQAAWSAGVRWHDLGNEAREVRAKVRDRITDARADGGTADIEELWEELEGLREERKRLAEGDGYGRESWSSFNCWDERLRAAFNDGAQRKVLAVKS